MKKYIAPSVQVVNVENEVILAGSDPRLGIDPTAGPVNSMQVNRRNAHYFFEEEDMDY